MVISLISRELYRSDAQVTYYTTTQKAILHMDNEALIWTALDDDEPLSLVDIE